MAQTTQRPTREPSKRPGKQPDGGKRPSVAERRAARAEEARIARQQRQRRQLLIVGIGALVLAIGAFFAIRAYQANQIGTAVADEGGGHVNDGTAITYKHYPPSSGRHYNAAQPAGIFKEEVQVGNWVHSLEHGYIVVLLRGADANSPLYEQLTALQKDLPPSKFGNVKFVVTPYSGQFSGDEAPITVLAWNRELKLDSFDGDQITRFYEKYVDGGPEGQVVQ